MGVCDGQPQYVQSGSTNVNVIGVLTQLYGISIGGNELLFKHNPL